MHVAVIGAGVAGLASAVTLAERGARVILHERSASLGGEAASWLAGGMLAPFCESESADTAIIGPGLGGIAWWRDRVPDVTTGGTLVLAPPRDAAELDRFAARTKGAGSRLDAEGVAALEPQLGGRFRRGLHYPGEAHLDPRRAMEALAERFVSLGGAMRFSSAADPEMAEGDHVVDCRGIAAGAAGLRSVRGEMLILSSREVSLSRPVRLLHPRSPIYVVPRGGGRFMVGATMIESSDPGGVTLRSAVELMNAAYALHPAFAEAEVLEMRAGLRPAFADNLPRVTQAGRVVTLAGLYRHGFLLAPDCARKAADLILGPEEGPESETP
ncbi:glycine oxidase ThiO [Fulvimarina endophytica]|uniref:Glycine oxidase ThiO n=1 Tax=Fulvimarina endophytica TaxID=2293836 RepID=A0A371X563_9HYPH|nr:glycine oxidase ThiO [Fulvimarina endophytica]RFC64378.1 glycine oxidase ThiO [Fulvimarina endophytica]